MAGIKKEKKERYFKTIHIKLHDQLDFSLSHYNSKSNTVPTTY